MHSSKKIGNLATTLKMKVQLTFLICWIYAASCTPYLSEWPKRMVVTEANKHEFELPIGTILKKDTHTGLYIPPPITDTFTPEDRLEIQFANNVTRRNFCRVGPNVDGTRITRKFFWNTFCRNSDGEDICCGKTRCSCDTFMNNCACLSKEACKYFEGKLQSDFNKTCTAIDTVGKLVSNVGGVVAAAGGK